MRTPRRALLLAALPLALAAASCFAMRETLHGSGVAASELRELPPFHAVSLAGSADVEISVGGPPAVEVTVDDNLLAYVVTEVDDGVLEIHLDDGYRYDLDVPLRVAVTAPELRGVSLAGSGDVVVRGVSTARFDVSIAGSGDVRLDGEAEDFDVSIAGSGDVDATALRALRASVSIAGSGSVLVNASDALDVSVAGSGDVGYRGAPEISHSILGSGSVYAAGAEDPDA